MAVTEWPAVIRYNRSHRCEEHVAYGFHKASHLDIWLALQVLRPRGVDCTDRTLFRRGEPCRGVYMVEEGSVKLLLSGHASVTTEFETVGAGTVLGLAETVTGDEYKLTAEAAEGARVSHIDRASFMDGLRQNHQLTLQIVRLLSDDLHNLYHRFLCMLPSANPADRQGPSSVH